MPTFEIKSRAPSLTWLGKEYFTWNNQTICNIDLISKFQLKNFQKQSLDVLQKWCS